MTRVRVNQLWNLCLKGEKVKIKGQEIEGALAVLVSQGTAIL
jgi:hypothetical protein